ncbi:phosphate signaling complex protein PhoU [Janibacter sp. GXQ6167]|uniref:phosphate signaling complex protein PhoU n=1 Tax=Janibacter sp. GXQ6167 TaxID=3240791 RepID=UPI00352351AE
MREVFHDELQRITDDLVEMAHRVGSAIARSTTALLDADVQLADSVIEADQAIDLKRHDLDAHAIDVLARQAPVATDLRVVVTAMRMSADLERMGDLARHVAKLARLRYPEAAVPDELRAPVLQMGQVGERLVELVAQVLVTQDLEETRGIEQVDDEMDSLQRDLFAVLVDGHWQHGTQSAVDMALLGRYYERFGDHAVSVARRMRFLVTGEFSESADDLDRGDQLPAGA